SLLAVAVLTGTKPTSLPMLLPWAILVFPLLPLVRRAWLPTLPVAALAAVASFLPLALMNQIYSGDWLGRTVELLHKEIHQPLVGIFGNAFQFILGNFLPPLFPWAGWWNAHALSVLPHAMVAALNSNFEPGILIVGEIPTEDTTGVGFGVCWLLVISMVAAIWIRGKSQTAPAAGFMPRWLCRSVMVGAWLALLAYSMKAGMNTGARLVSPFYLPLMPLLLVGAGQAEIVRRGWWRLLAGGTMALALLVLVLSPDRPLWPAQTILSKVLARHPGQAAVTRALQVYTLYSHRNDALAGVRALLPPDATVIGLVGDGDDCDISLWRPFGTRRVEHFFLTDPPAFIQSRVKYVVVGGYILGVGGVSIDDWLQKNDAELVCTTNAILKIGEGEQSWYVTRFKP
ncbi:MAG TPA: hypothetical protein VH251_10710, partial [Verrucomicrobiae bacterium]|nr:hypothetical protein [Verrucomicrobiae bacterium]